MGQGAPVFVEGGACATHNGTMASPSLMSYNYATQSHAASLLRRVTVEEVRLK